MVRCSVFGCKSDSERKLPDLSFHSFPRDQELQMQWIEATGRKNWTPKISSRICSTHFEKNVLIKKNKLTVLFPKAVPLLECNINISRPSTSSQVQECVEIDDNLAQPSSNTGTPATEAANKSPQLNEPTIKVKSPTYTPRTMRRKFHRTVKQSADRLKKLRALREKSRRLTKRVANLGNVIAELKAKCLVTEEDGDLLESIDPANKDFLKKYYVLLPTSP